MRVYEWGPESGRKVLFIHGNTIPSPMFANIAASLVKKGCRVLLLDQCSKSLLYHAFKAAYPIDIADRFVG